MIGVWVAGWEQILRPDLLSRLPQLGPEGRARIGLAREMGAAVGDVVEQDHVPDLAGMGRRVGPGAAQCAVLKVAVPAARRGLLPVEEDEADLGMASRQLGRQRPRQLDQRRRPGRAVVGADEALRPELRVVVGTDHDGRAMPRDVADDVPEPLLRALARERLEGPVGKRPPQPVRQAAELRGARGPRADRDLLADERHGAARVERRLLRGVAGPAAANEGEPRQRENGEARRPACPCA